MTILRDEDGEPVEILARMRVVRDSDDLGLDRGMLALVIRVRDDRDQMDFYVPALDAEIAFVAIDHPDLVQVS